ncbi:unnamed protein product [Somion occarium]|uniref:DUF803-domain-containing protein n=1 Tax=Somion occarium TaxID=3059160 RepID=A0ABP1D3R8_9APHY
MIMHWPNSSHNGDTIDVKLPQLSKATATGISVAIAGNVLISLALNCQKLAHLRMEREREAKREAVDALGDHPRASSTDRGSDDSHFAIRPNGAELTSTETEPLLGSPASKQNSVKRGSVHRRPLLSTVWGRATSATRSADRTHVGAIHAVMPVDVVRFNGTSNSDGDNFKSGELEDAHAGNESDYLKSKLWWMGFLLMNVGEVGNFISYAFAPASVVAPLGTLDFFGIIIAILGAVTVVLSANPSETRLDPAGLIEAISRPAFVVYATVYIAGIVILSGLSESSIGKRWVYVDIGLCAFFGGFTVLSTKAISTLLTLEWFEIFTEWITYPVLSVLIGTGIGQIRYLNRALMRFDSKIVVPTQFVLFNLSAILGSAILYGDFEKATFHQIVTFLYGCGATFLGVFLITWTPRSASSKEEELEDLEDEEETAASTSDTMTDPRNVRLGSISRHNRAILVVPEGATRASTSPSLARKQSIVSMIGLSSAQRALIVHTPPHDTFIRPLSPDIESNRTSPMHSPDTFTRRRAVSWLGNESRIGSARGSPRIPRAHSRLASREVSRDREENTSTPV